MFYIDASMVGSLGAEASASIGLVEPATWLFRIARRFRLDGLQRTSRPLYRG